MRHYYRTVAQEDEVFEHCFRNQLPLLVKGPTGCGKSQFVQAMAEKFGRPLVQVTCNEDTTASDLLGRYLIRSMETFWQDGPVLRAIRQGAILYLDELVEAREDVLVLVHPLTDHRRSLYVDRLNEEFHAPPEFMCVASYNPGYQRGLKDLKPSTRQRFVTLSLSYPDPKVEAEILAQVSGLDSSRCRVLAEFAAKIRKQTQLGLKETISTRLLVQTAVLLSKGLPPRMACQVGIVEALTDDAGTRGALADLVALHF